jgi:hypothetical protein
MFLGVRQNVVSNYQVLGHLRAPAKRGSFPYRRARCYPGYRPWECVPLTNQPCFLAQALSSIRNWKWGATNGGKPA